MQVGHSFSSIINLEADPTGMAVRYTTLVNDAIGNLVSTASTDVCHEAWKTMMPQAMTITGTIVERTMTDHSEQPFVPNEMNQSHSLLRRRLLRTGCYATVAGLLMSSLGKENKALAASGGQLGGHGPHSFLVGEYLKFQSYRDSSGAVQSTKGYLDDAWFEALGLIPINVVYATRYLNGSGLSATLNEGKLRAIAADANPRYPVSLDAEEWDKNRFQPDAPTPNGKSIVQNLIDVVRTFKRTNPAAQVGLYSEVPQSTYGFLDSTASVHDKLNPKYAAVAAETDYYSPSLYNYDNYDGTAAGDRQWARAAEYAVHACKLLDSVNRTAKPILPYVTPGWTDAEKIPRYLSYEKMHFRLETLRKLGASGCILWLSSAAKEQGSNEKLILDPNTGWLRAAVEFARIHK